MTLMTPGMPRGNPAKFLHASQDPARPRLVQQPLWASVLLGL